MPHDLVPQSKVFRLLFWAAAILMLSINDVAGKFTPYAKAITLEYVPYLIFQKWKLTNYRRNEPIYQLKCLAGCEYEPDWVKCHNVPAPSGRGPAWRCETDLPSHLQFSTLEVVCEGYESKDDDYVLDGSCGLEYSLKHITLPAPNPVVAKEAHLISTTPHFEIESQWSGCHWLILGSVIYVCCYCLYRVVQDDLREALTTRCRNVVELPARSLCARCQQDSLAVQEMQEPFKLREPSTSMTTSEQPKMQSWEVNQRQKSPPFHSGPFKESIFKSPIGRPLTPIRRSSQKASLIHRLARAETQGKKDDEGGNSSGSEFSAPSSPTNKGRNIGQDIEPREGKEKTSSQRGNPNEKPPR